MRPIPIDCTPETLNVMSHNLIDRLKTNNIRALFLTNVLGFVGDIDKIKEICDTRGIILIEDNCESLGTELPTGKAGNFGVGASFSFFVAHHMSTIEGGMVCTDDEELAEMLKITRANGWDRNLTAAQQLRLRRTHGIKSEFEAKYTFYDLGFNFRPTEITGFLGLFQLQFLDATIKTRRSNFLKFQSVSLTNSDFLHLKHDHINILSTFALPIVCKSAVLRARYMAQFAGAGVEIRPMIAGNLQRQPFYRKYVTEFFSLPGSDFLHDNGFYCGNYPELSQSDIETIMSCLHPHHT